MDSIFTYNLTNAKRDVSEIFNLMIAENPMISSYMTTNAGAFAYNHKHEWMEDRMAPKKFTLTGNHVAADGLLAITGTTGLKQGMVLKFTKNYGLANETESTLVALVGTVTAGVGCAITVFGGSVDENLASGTIASVLSTPKGELSTLDFVSYQESTKAYNFTQIFRTGFVIPRSVISTQQYGMELGGIVAEQAKKELINMAYDMAMTSFSMPRTERSSVNPGTMGGVGWFLDTFNENKVNASATVITDALLNSAFSELRRQGATPTTIVCNPKHAKRISAFNKDKILYNRTDSTVGTYANTFLTNFGDVVEVSYVDVVPSDKLYIVNKNDVSPVPLYNSAFSIMDATIQGNTDGVAMSITGEYTLQVKNSKNGHAVIYGLTN